MRPINEKNAISRFANGLRSQKLSTIISARNFTTLKDAIRAAEDESTASNASEQVFSYHDAGNRRGRGTDMLQRGFRGRHRGNYQGLRQYSQNNNNSGYDHSRGYRGGNRGYRGNRYFNKSSYRGGSGYYASSNQDQEGRMNYMTNDSLNTNSRDHEQNENHSNTDEQLNTHTSENNQFFRE